MCGVDGCGYSGYRYQVHTHHLTDHCPLSEVPFLCTECGARFSAKAKVEGHRVQHHPKQTVEIFTGSLMDNFEEIPMHKIIHKENLHTKLKPNTKRSREKLPPENEREERQRELYRSVPKKRILSTLAITLSDDDDEPRKKQEAKDVLAEDLVL